MARNWDRYSRHGLDIAIAATSIGFHVAKVGTRVGFSIAKGICTTAASVSSSVVDSTLFGAPVASPIMTGAVTSALTLAERITLAPIHLGEYITSTSLLAAHSSVNVLSVFFPGSSEASFSLASFIDLVRREWRDPPEQSMLPVKQYGIFEIGRAVVAWVALQGVTQEWQERRWFSYLKELDVKDAPKRTDHHKTHIHARVRVTSDVIFSGEGGSQIITAHIGESSRSHASRLRLKKSRSKLSMRQPSFTSLIDEADVPEESLSDLKATLRRLSKMVLAGYGGASLLFFGVPPRRQSMPKPAPEHKDDPADVQEKNWEEAKLATAIDASEAEAAGETCSRSGDSDDSPDILQYSWWDILLGKHDQEIFESSLNDETSSTKDKFTKFKSQLKARAVIGDEHLMPRFWVLTDYSRGEIVLVLRGTMSVNEVAADLTCEPEWFQPAETPQPSEEDEYHVPGRYAFEFPTFSARKRKSRANSVDSAPRYHVHGGMLKMAKLMGDIGRPVQLAVMEALHHNPGFDLVLCGHSLGAGVAALLGMIWADPKTCLTVPSSGLPVGRQVSVYCFAPPALTDVALSRLTRKLIVSFVYSTDVVARLSLGSIRDIRNAAMWLCAAHDSVTHKHEGYAALTSRAREFKAGNRPASDSEWFIAIRKTLEASMQNSDMFPPGRVLWAVRDNDLHPSHKRWEGTAHENKLRLFDVLNVEGIFKQIQFSRDMLTAHMPHQYDKALHELL